MENKADMPNWNRFVNEILSGKYRQKGSETRVNENSLQCGQDSIPAEAHAGTDKENTMQS